MVKFLMLAQFVASKDEYFALETFCRCSVEGSRVLLLKALMKSTGRLGFVFGISQVVKIV